MSDMSLNRVGRPRVGPATRSEAGEIRNTGRAELAKSGAVGDIDSAHALGPGHADSAADGVRRTAASPHSPMGPITQHLGQLLTVANPAWSGDPLPRMRALQKKLIEHSLNLSQEERGPCLQAISVVEQAVQMRLRLQQMRIDDFTLHADMEAQQR